MTKEELAAKLNGREYLAATTEELEVEARNNNLVIAYGESDDLLEFRGAIDDEVGAFNGTAVLITYRGLLQNECNDDDCPYFKRVKATTTDKVEAIYDTGGYSWMIQSNLPYAPFDIMEDGKKFCRGIVFELPEEK